MAVIKSAHVPAAASAFSMRDIETHAKAILIRARQQAEALLIDAQNEAELLKAQARAEGLIEGRREGHALGKPEGLKSGAEQGLAEQKEELTALMNGLIAACIEFDAVRNELAAEGLDEVVQLSVAIARRVTKRLGLLDPEVLTENLKEAMKLVAHSADLRIAINPKQKAYLDSVLPQLQISWPELKHIELVEDPEMTLGGCRLMTARGSINGDIQFQLDRVIESILPAGTEDLVS